MPNYITLENAAQRLESVNTVMVIGCSGGGKSTLAQRLASALKLDYISIDRDIRWLPDWTVRERSEQKKLFEEFSNGERWIMDGTSPSSFDIRVPRTDLVLWVRVPRYVALYGVYKRVFNYYGTTRPDMAKGCKEQLPDWEFLSYIWNFEKKSAPVVIQNLDLYGSTVPVAILKSRKALDFLAERVKPSLSKKDERVLP